MSFIGIQLDLIELILCVCVHIGPLVSPLILYNNITSANVCLCAFELTSNCIHFCNSRLKSFSFFCTSLHYRLPFKHSSSEYCAVVWFKCDILLNTYSYCKHIQNITCNTSSLFTITISLEFFLAFSYI